MEVEEVAASSSASGAPVHPYVALACDQRPKTIPVTKKYAVGQHMAYLRASGWTHGQVTPSPPRHVHAHVHAHTHI